MKISKVRKVKSPTRGTDKAAGIDFYVPDDSFPFPGEHFLAPGQDVVIPSGVHAKVPEGYALIAFNKSGVATKKGLQVGACVVDEDYQGEIHIHVTNVSADLCSIKNGEKLVQFLLIPVSLEIVEEVPRVEDLYEFTSKRGAGKFGSTNKADNE